MRYALISAVRASLTLGLGLLAACTAAPRTEMSERPALLDVASMLETPVLTLQASEMTPLLQAISAVSTQVVWASGHQGIFVRTTDGGATWHAARVPGPDTLQFRDVHAVSADTAWLMSAGSGELSRIYRTTDGGRSWTLQHLERDPDAFFDCMSFWDSNNGFVFSDAVRGSHVILRTNDGGATWVRVPAHQMPAALPGEGSFAASGTCSAVAGRSHGWVGTGNAATPRALRTTDGGMSWTPAELPVVGGTSAGIASTIFRDTLHGIALGGEIDKPAARGDYVAITADGGKSWTPGGRLTFAGAVYGAAYVPGVGAPVVVAVGPGGADVSRDEGRSWTRLDSTAYWSVAFASPRDGWAVGPRGRIVKIRLF
jgi:photosystem II stability/assembly factor-like uncharacterized protein